MFELYKEERRASTQQVEIKGDIFENLQKLSSMLRGQNGESVYVNGFRRNQANNDVVKGWKKVHEQIVLGIQHSLGPDFGKNRLRTGRLPYKKVNDMHLFLTTKPCALESLGILTPTWKTNRTKEEEQKENARKTFKSIVHLLLEAAILTSLRSAESEDEEPVIFGGPLVRPKVIKMSDKKKGGDASHWLLGYRIIVNMNRHNILSVSLTKSTYTLSDKSNIELAPDTVNGIEFAAFSSSKLGTLYPVDKVDSRKFKGKDDWIPFVRYPKQQKESPDIVIKSKIYHLNRLVDALKTILDGIGINYEPVVFKATHKIVDPFISRSTIEIVKKITLVNLTGQDISPHVLQDLLGLPQTVQPKERKKKETEENSSPRKSKRSNTKASKPKEPRIEPALVESIEVFDGGRDASLLVESDSFPFNKKENYLFLLPARKSYWQILKNTDAKVQKHTNFHEIKHLFSQKDFEKVDPYTYLKLKKRLYEKGQYVLQGLTEIQGVPSAEVGKGLSYYQKLSIFDDEKEQIESNGIRAILKNVVMDITLKRLLLDMGSIPLPGAEDQNFTAFYCRSPKSGESECSEIDFKLEDGNLKIVAIRTGTKDSKYFKTNIPERSITKRGDSQVERAMNDQFLLIDEKRKYFISVYTNDYFTPTLIGNADRPFLDILSDGEFLTKSRIEDQLPYVTAFTASKMPENKCVFIEDHSEVGYLSYIVSSLLNPNVTVENPNRIYHLIAKDFSKRKVQDINYLELPLVKLYFRTLTRDIQKINGHSKTSIIKKLLKILIEN